VVARGEHYLLLEKDIVMNKLKALITSLVVASSSAAMAKPIAVSGSASIHLGTTSSVVVRDHRTPVADPCGTPAPRPVYTQPIYQPVYQPVYSQPVYQEPFWSPTNTKISASSSTYLGTFGQAPVYIRAHAPVWFNLTEATRVDGGRELFNLQGRGGTFSKLALKNLGGRTQIAQIAIEFRLGNGRVETQKVRFDQTLSRSASLTVDLAHSSRDINRIIVYGTSGRGSAYQILAM
jgi:hypothetical protein